MKNPCGVLPGGGGSGNSALGPLHPLFSRLVKLILKTSALQQGYHSTASSCLFIGSCSRSTITACLNHITDSQHQGIYCPFWKQSTIWLRFLSGLLNLGQATNRVHSWTIFWSGFHYHFRTFFKKTDVTVLSTGTGGSRLGSCMTVVAASWELSAVSLSFCRELSQGHPQQSSSSVVAHLFNNLKTDGHI